MFPFHYAFKVKDLASTRKFYMEILGCSEGRASDNWVDFDFFGHQLSAHQSDNLIEPDFCSLVDNKKIPVPHFGCVVDAKTFADLSARLTNADVEFIVKPYKRFEGKAGEQNTLFVFDFSGNPLEFKSFNNQESLFAKD